MGIFGQGVQLVNQFKEERDVGGAASNEAKGTETLSLGGGGFSFSVNFANTNLQARLALGYLMGTLSHTGDTPVTQKYSAGSASVGVGAAPLPGDSGVLIRADYQYIPLLSGKEEGNEDKRLAPQLFEGVSIALGYIFGV